ncbi:MAG TPA: hypothetical protein VJU13_07555 [Candidatus Nitrosocosmicus sp.]|nr:hypothetical protein [Candidatus Nitrosocosmicus sp.]
MTTMSTIATITRALAARTAITITSAITITTMTRALAAAAAPAAAAPAAAAPAVAAPAPPTARVMYLWLCRLIQIWLMNPIMRRIIPV